MFYRGNSGRGKWVRVHTDRRRKSWQINCRGFDRLTLRKTTFYICLEIMQFRRQHQMCLKKHKRTVLLVCIGSILLVVLLEAGSFKNYSGTEAVNIRGSNQVSHLSLSHAVPGNSIEAARSFKVGSGLGSELSGLPIDNSWFRCERAAEVDTERGQYFLDHPQMNTELEHKLITEAANLAANRCSGSPTIVMVGANDLEVEQGGEEASNDPFNNVIMNLYPKSRAVLVEPVPHVFKMLSKHVSSLAPRVKPINSAICDATSSGMIDFTWVSEQFGIDNPGEAHWKKFQLASMAYSKNLYVEGYGIPEKVSYLIIISLPDYTLTPNLEPTYSMSLARKSNAILRMFYYRLLARGLRMSRCLASTLKAWILLSSVSFSTYLISTQLGLFGSARTKIGRARKVTREIRRVTLDFP